MEIVNKIVAFDKFESELALFKDKFEGIIYDFDDDDQMKSAMADKHQISKVRGSIDKVHKEGKAKAKSVCDLWDNEKNRIKEVANNLYDGIDQQIKDHKQKVIDHDNSLNEMVNHIKEYPDNFASDNFESMQQAIDSLNSMVIDDTYEHRENDAIAERLKSISILQGKIALLEKQEAQAKQEQEELAKVQKEREEKIAKDAAAESKKLAEASEKARIESERQAEIEKIAAQEKAEQDARDAEKERLADIEAEKLKAETERVEAERRAEIQVQEAIEKTKQDEINRVAEINRLADIDKAKIDKARANQKHRANIHSEAKESLIAAGFGNVVATKIISEIKDGNITNVFINY